MANIYVWSSLFNKPDTAVTAVMLVGMMSLEMGYITFQGIDIWNGEDHSIFGYEELLNVVLTLLMPAFGLMSGLNSLFHLTYAADGGMQQPTSVSEVMVWRWVGPDGRSFIGPVQAMTVPLIHLLFFFAFVVGRRIPFVGEGRPDPRGGSGGSGGSGGQPAALAAAATAAGFTAHAGRGQTESPGGGLSDQLIIRGVGNSEQSSALEMLDEDVAVGIERRRIENAGGAGSGGAPGDLPVLQVHDGVPDGLALPHPPLLLAGAQLAPARSTLPV